MSKTTELVERLRELPRDTRKATVEIYDLCIEASYEIEGLTVTTSEKREAWIHSGMSSSVLGQVVEKWNGLADERRGGQ